MPADLRAPARGLAGAFAFLTVVPVPVRRIEGFELGPALPWFPVVGAGVGAVGGGLRLILSAPLGATTSTVLALAGMVALTGALHADALADTADGLGVRGDRERRLAVMRDSTVGAFGVLALVLWGLAAFAAVSSLSAAHALLALIAAGSLGRAGAVAHGRLAPPARTDGLGAALGVTTARTLAAVLIAAAIAVAAVGPVRGALGVAVALGVSSLTAIGVRRMLGGATGDTLGATVVLGELAVVLTLLASWR